MAVIDQVDQEIAQAMKARDTARLGALRLLKTALVNRSVEKGRALEGAEEQQVIATLVKQRREAAEQFEHAGRTDLANREAAEIPILESYQAAKADAAAIESAIDRAIADTGATSAKDIGRVMKAVMALLAGLTVDGRAVNDMVRQKLGRP